MRSIALFIFLSTLLNLSYAFDTSVRGFIALDTLKFQKIEDQNASLVTGIGVLDLKIFAEQDNMTAALKLDLDGKLNEANNIFEEAYATYRGIRDFRFSAGKGVVRFQNLHWGSVLNTYYDGGTVLETENSFRKLSKKAYASVSYGHRSRGFLNTFWFWGDSQEYKINDQGNPEYQSSSSKITGYTYDAVKSFNTRYQTGLANRIELFTSSNWTLSNGLVYYKKKFQSNASYAVDLSGVYETSDIEIWIDLLFGHTNKPPVDSYSTYSNDEHYLQVGVDKFLDETWSWVSNFEILYTENQAWNYTGLTLPGTSLSIDSRFTNKSNQFVKTTSYKLESALKYKLSKTSFATMGGMYENKKSSKNGVKDLSYIPDVKNPNKDAYMLIGSVSFWF